MFDQYTPNVKAAIISAVVVVGLAALGAAYQVGYGNGAKDLETINDFRKADLPGMMNDIKILAKNFRERAELTDENQRVTKELSYKNETDERLKQEIATQQDNISRLKKSAEELEKTVSEVFPTDVLPKSIPQGTAERIIPNVVTIGVVTILGDFVSVTINGSSRTMYPGGNETVNAVGRKCTIELVKIDKPGLTADFVVSCIKR